MRKKVFSTIAATLCLITIAFTATGCAFIDWVFETGAESCSTYSHEHETEYVEAIEATCVSAGHKAYWYCAGCDNKYYDEKATQYAYQQNLHIPPKPHGMVYHKEVESTCTTCGTREYWSCASCGTNFRDEQGTGTINSTELPLKEHSVSFVGETPATETEAGERAHYTCKECHGNFRDEDATRPMTDDELIIPAGKPAAT